MVCIVTTNCTAMDINLKIASWNISGLAKKVDDPEFVNSINKFNICFFARNLVIKKLFY